MIFCRKLTINMVLGLGILLIYLEITSCAMHSPPSIIIIGTGASGIAAGTKLYENGVKNILWLEAANRIGGRINTQKFADSVIEFGAHWCHGEKDNVVFELAEPFELLSHSIGTTDPAIFVNPSGANLPRLDVSQLYDTLEDIVDDEDDEMVAFNGSMGEFVHLKFQERLETDLNQIDSTLSAYVYEWFHKVQESSNGAETLNDMSAKLSTEYWECEGDGALNWQTHGYKTILDVLMKKIPDTSKALPLEDKFLLNKEVVNIDWSGPGVTVKCTDGTQYRADHVIVTVSLGVLKECSASFFKPELPPNKLQAIRDLGFGTVNKLFFEFPYRWWPANHGGFNFVWNDVDIKDKLKMFDGPLADNKWLLDVYGFYPVDYQPHVLLGWIVSSSARQMEEVPADEVRTKLMQLLRMFLSNQFEIPDAVSFQRTKWYTNPYFRGSYSYLSMAALNTSTVDLAEPLKSGSGRDLVLFAGEVTHPHYYSTVHGAIESGWREADRLLKMYQI